MGLALIINIIGMFSTGIAAGLNFDSGDIGKGVLMVLLFIINLVCFIFNMLGVLR